MQRQRVLILRIYFDFKSIIYMNNDFSYREGLVGKRNAEKHNFTLVFLYHAQKASKRR